jgi:hypothetical protein
VEGRELEERGEGKRIEERGESLFNELLRAPSREDAALDVRWYVERGLASLGQALSLRRSAGDRG